MPMPVSFAAMSARVLTELFVANRICNPDWRRLDIAASAPSIMVLPR